MMHFNFDFSGIIVMVSEDTSSERTEQDESSLLKFA